ncbi:hypothetical protein RND81_10G148100 [Saponaria officinalis]|uniref:Peptidase A1 domain-containing protein n=1 Tax=Saponaria officinalis TaxID=3572 RepID=A0AAW1I2T3_SAPOF
MTIYLCYFTILSLYIFHLTEAHLIGFSANLIHRDSPLSPLSTKSLNQYERLQNSIQRSMSYSTSASGDVQSKIRRSQGQYIMELSYGTPPVSQFGIIDTGSNFIWTQCQPCVKCFTQTFPIFDPRKSSTYKALHCDSQACKALFKHPIACAHYTKLCEYSFTQSIDGSRKVGVLATETITFKSKGSTEGLSFPMINIGCGHDSAGTFTRVGAGQIGLSSGPLSLVSQLGGKFSYCLNPFDMESSNYSSSRINFGTKAVVSGPDTISTPIVKSRLDTFYYLTLEAISVGETKIPFSRNSFVTVNNITYTRKGNMLIDSGTEMTILPRNMYTEVQNALIKAIKGGERIQDPNGQLQLCYKTNLRGADLDIPYLTAHFDGGDVVWKPVNLFTMVAEKVMCLTIIPSKNIRMVGVLGNIAQMNFLVGYDIVEGKVSFKPTICSQHE